MVPGFELADLRLFEERGAVGLLVPGAGPETSRELALASLVRGEVRNSLRGGIPPGAPVLELSPGEEVDADRAAVYVGLPEGGRQANDRRYPILIVGDGFEGLLTSSSTRIPGLVSIADVAPTALGGEDGLGYEPAGDAAGEVLALDRRIDEHNVARYPATLVAVALVVLLAVASRRAAVAGLAAALAANLVLGLAGVSSTWPTVLAIGLAAALGGPLLARFLHSHLALGGALATVLAAYLLALGLDGSGVALSAFGPTQNSRFFGLSNLLETLLLVPALGGAALLGSRLGPAAFAGVALLAFVTVAGNRFGADGGGAIVLAAGFAVLAVLMAKARGRVLVAALAGAGVLALLLLALDAATGGSSHVTRSLRGGPTGLASDLAERVELSYQRITAGWLTGLLVGALACALALLVARTFRRGITVEDDAVALALAAAIAVSLVVNDSPNDVLLGGLAGYVAAERGMLPARWPGRSRSSSSSPSLWSRAAAAARPSRPPPRP